MSTQVFIGKLGGSIPPPRLTEIFIGTPGFVKTTAGDMMQIFFSGTAGGFVTTPNAWTAADNSKLGYSKNIKWTHPSYANDPLYLANAVLLCQGAGTAAKDLVGQVSVFAKDEGGLFYNLIQSPNLQDFVGTPACSTTMTLNGTKYTNNEKESKYDWVLNGSLFPAQMDYLAAQSTAYVATGTAVTGGVTNTLTAITSSRVLRVFPSGFHTLNWTPTGGSASDFGVLDSMELTLELKGGPLQYNKECVRQIAYTAKGRTKQLNALQMQAANENSYLDGTLGLVGYGGFAPSFVNARGSFEVHAGGNDWGYVEVDMSGDISIASANFTTPMSPVFTLNNN